MSLGTESITTHSAVSLVHYEASDIGRRREENQDSFGVLETPNFSLFVVADGMGGVQGGAIASGLAVETLKSALQHKTEIVADDIRQAVEAANVEVFKRGCSDPTLTGMGTTLVGLMFVGTRLFVVNVGDSRAYLVRRGSIRRLTEDHTLVTELLRAGTITADQALNHPVAHMLTRSLGPAGEVDVDCALLPHGPFRGDRFLLCSDGLYNLVRDEEIVEALTKQQLEPAAQYLIAKANERGGSDNITVALVEAATGFPEWVPEQRAEKDADEDDGEERKRPAQPEERLGYIPGDGSHAAGNGAHTAQQHSSAQEREASEAKANERPQGKKKSKSKISLESLKASWQGEGLADNAGNAADKKARKPGSVISYLSVIAAFVVTAIAGSFVGVMIASPPRSGQDEDSAVRARNQRAEYQGGQVDAAGVGKRTPAGGQAAALVPVPQNSHLEGAGGHIPDIGGLERRASALRERVLQIDQQIAAFDGQVSGKLAEMLRAAMRKREETRRALDGIRSELDLATRKLAVWYGRRKRLETTEPVNLASEVAISSELVREKKSTFEKVTWEYLSEYEKLKYDPTNPAQSKKVNELIRARNQRLEELSNEVRQAINVAIGESDRLIAEQTLRRDQVEADLHAIEGEIEFVKVVSGNDAQAREAKKAELLQERELVNAELEELLRIQRTSQQSGPESPSSAPAITQDGQAEPAGG